MANAGIKWTVASPKVIQKNITAYGALTQANVKRVAESVAKDGRAYMKSNRPWNDQTGEARRTLDTSVEQNPAQTVITFGHGVEYGIFLEVLRGGRDAIVRPAVQKFSEETMRRLRNLNG